MNQTANANLYALLKSRFPDDPAALLMEVPDGRRVTYAEVDEESSRLAGLLKGLGVEAGDRVAVQVEKSPEAVMLYLACLRRGVVYLPLNTAYTGDEVAYFLDDARPRLLVCRPEDVDVLIPIAAQAGVSEVRTLDIQGGGSLMAEAAGAEHDRSVAPMESNTVAAILYTSGTTGRSKGAMITHGNLASNALSLHRIWGWRKGDVLLHVLPIYHVHGLFVALHCAMLNASPMLFLNRFDVNRVVETLPRATVMMGVPTHYTRLLDHPAFGPEACRNMRLFISGSAPLLAETFRAFAARSGHEILERYGMTEAGMITSNPLEGARVVGTVGFPLPDVRVRVADPDEAGVGVLEIAGPNVFAGYWQRPEKTRAEFRADGWFITGDLARVDDEGRVTIVGRARDLVISGGLNVYPKEVEDALDHVLGVRESAVIGVQHRDLGEAVVAIVVSDGTRDLKEGEVLSGVRGRLAGFKRPKRVFLVDALPRNTMGKVQKTELRERFGKTFVQLS